MSTSDYWTDGDMDQTGEKKGKDDGKQPQRLRSNKFAKRKVPTGFNGMHRRRNKRAAW